MRNISEMILPCVCCEKVKLRYAKQKRGRDILSLASHLLFIAVLLIEKERKGKKTLLLSSKQKLQILYPFSTWKHLEHSGWGIIIVAKGFIAGCLK